MVDWGQFTFPSNDHPESSSGQVDEEYKLMFSVHNHTQVTESNNNEVKTTSYTTTTSTTTNVNRKHSSDAILPSEKNGKPQHWAYVAKILNSNANFSDGGDVDSSTILNVPVSDSPRNPLRRQQSHQESLNNLSSEMSMYPMMASTRKARTFDRATLREFMVDKESGGTNNMTNRNLWRSSSFSVGTMGFLPRRRFQSAARDSSGRLMEKEGILRMREQIKWTSSWKECLIVLQKNAVSFYSVSDQTKGKLGSILIRTDSRCQAVQNQKRNFCFVISNSKDVVYFQCPSKQARDSWIHATNAAIEYITSFSTVSGSHCGYPGINSSNNQRKMSSSHQDPTNEQISAPIREYCLHSHRPPQVSPPVTPPMEIYPKRSPQSRASPINAAMRRQSDGKKNGIQSLIREHREPLPPSPAVARVLSSEDSSKKLMNPTWPLPNYRFADPDKVDSKRHMKEHQVVLP